MQPAAPREALLVLPGSRHSPAAGGCAQLWARLPGRALGGRGRPAGGGTGVELESASEQREARPAVRAAGAGGRKQAREVKLPVTLWVS